MAESHAGKFSGPSHSKRTSLPSNGLASATRQKERLASVSRALLGGNGSAGAGR
jgi:hypothetical protein